MIPTIGLMLAVTGWIIAGHVVTRSAAVVHHPDSGVVKTLAGLTLLLSIAGALALGYLGLDLVQAASSSTGPLR